MNHLTVLENNLAEAQALIAELRESERRCVAEINRLGPQEGARGTDCPISARIAALDAQRREFAAGRVAAAKQAAVLAGLIAKARRAFAA